MTLRFVGSANAFARLVEQYAKDPKMALADHEIVGLRWVHSLSTHNRHPHGSRRHSSRTTLSFRTFSWYTEREAEVAAASFPVARLRETIRTRESAAIGKIYRGYYANIYGDQHQFVRALGPLRAPTYYRRGTLSVIQRVILQPNEPLIVYLPDFPRSSGFQEGENRAFLQYFGCSPRTLLKLADAGFVVITIGPVREYKSSIVRRLLSEFLGLRESVRPVFANVLDRYDRTDEAASEAQILAQVSRELGVEEEIGGIWELVSNWKRRDNPSVFAKWLATRFARLSSLGTGQSQIGRLKLLSEALSHPDSELLGEIAADAFIADWLVFVMATYSRGPNISITRRDTDVWLAILRRISHGRSSTPSALAKMGAREDQARPLVFDAVPLIAKLPFSSARSVPTHVTSQDSIALIPFLRALSESPDFREDARLRAGIRREFARPDIGVNSERITRLLAEFGESSANVAELTPGWLESHQRRKILWSVGGTLSLDSIDEFAGAPELFHGFAGIADAAAHASLRKAGSESRVVLPRTGLSEARLLERAP